jgi:hypothetical protein
MNENDSNIPTSKRKTGPKKKTLVEGTYMGIEVGRGDNKKIIDPKEVEKLASIGMKDREIAEYLDIDDSTLTYNFKLFLIKGRHNLRISLRRAQLSLALSGNATMLIWLGRNILGQSDSSYDSEANAPLPWNED